jgi:hypothetical protein
MDLSLMYMALEVEILGVGRRASSVERLAEMM